MTGASSLARPGRRQAPLVRLASRRSRGPTHRAGSWRPRPGRRPTFGERRHRPPEVGRLAVVKSITGNWRLAADRARRPGSGQALVRRATGADAAGDEDLTRQSRRRRWRPSRKWRGTRRSRLRPCRACSTATARCHPDLVRRVRAAVEALGYQPNSVARNLRRRESSLWAVIVPDVGNPFFTSMVRGVEDVAQGSGYSVVLCNSDEGRARKPATSRPRPPSGWPAWSSLRRPPATPT